jgi:hypothetical protein
VAGEDGLVARSVEVVVPTEDGHNKRRQDHRFRQSQRRRSFGISPFIHPKRRQRPRPRSPATEATNPPMNTATVAAMMRTVTSIGQPQGGTGHSHLVCGRNTVKATTIPPTAMRIPNAKATRRARLLIPLEGTSCPCDQELTPWGRQGGRLGGMPNGAQGLTCLRSEVFNEAPCRGG